MSDPAYPLRLVDEHSAGTAADERSLVESYRRLADVFHDVLAEQSLDALLDRIADALAELIPHDSLTKASRSHDAVSVLMLDIDDFKRVNDIFGHGAGDEILRSLAVTLRRCVRVSDVVCRLGGEEFAIVMTSRNPENAEHLARRLVDRVAAEEFDPAGRITVSVGLARGPEHAMNPRELIACAEAAMMTAKARGKNQIVLYDDSSHERPEGELGPSTRDVRSVAHMKMLQSLGGKLNRLNDVREIGNVIANELRSLIDYHNCRVFAVEGENVVPIAFVGTFSRVQPSLEMLAGKLGHGITGHVAVTGASILVGDAAN